MSYFFEFPHTRTYDSDLGWLIKTVQEISDQYQSLVEWMETHEEDYQGLLSRVTNLENTISTFQSDIDNRFDTLQNQLEEEIFQQIQAALAAINTDLTEFRVQLTWLRDDLERAILDLNSLVEADRAYMIAYIEARLQAFIDSIPDLTTVNVFNPVRGETTSIQIAVDDLYDHGRSEALTALEYDSIGLTASEYDSLLLSAYDYDNYGKTLIQLSGFYKNPWHYMTSPFTGEYVPLETVINELASLHKDDALTATEYDTLDITATYYDALDLTAYDYDWHGKTLVS